MRTCVSGRPGLSTSKHWTRLISDIRYMVTHPSSSIKVIPDTPIPDNQHLLLSSIGHCTSFRPLFTLSHQHFTSTLLNSTPLHSTPLPPCTVQATKPPTNNATNTDTATATANRYRCRHRYRLITSGISIGPCAVAATPVDNSPTYGMSE